MFRILAAGLVIICVSQSASSAPICKIRGNEGICQGDLEFAGLKDCKAAATFTYKGTCDEGVLNGLVLVQRPSDDNADPRGLALDLVVFQRGRPFYPLLRYAHQIVGVTDRGANGGIFSLGCVNFASRWDRRRSDASCVQAAAIFGDEMLSQDTWRDMRKGTFSGKRLSQMEPNILARSLDSTSLSATNAAKSEPSGNATGGSPMSTSELEACLVEEPSLMSQRGWTVRNSCDFPLRIRYCWMTGSEHWVNGNNTCGNGFVLESPYLEPQELYSYERRPASRDGRSSSPLTLQGGTRRQGFLQDDPKVFGGGGVPQ